MTNWRPISELTPEIVEAAWRLIVWNGEETFFFQEYLSDDGFVLDAFDGEWCVYIDGLPERYPVTYFAVIDAPPEDANT